MKESVPAKFKEKVDLTYEQYFRARYGGMVQLAREFERAAGRKKAFERIKKAAEKSAVESVKTQMSNRKPIRSFEDFKTFTKENMKSPFLANSTTATFAEETRKKLVLHVTECLWAKTFKDLGATDLGYIMFCHPDFAVASAYHPRIKLRRTKTLMQGDAYCNHTWCWEGESSEKQSRT